jgi:hypothetical protein
MKKKDNLVVENREVKIYDDGIFTIEVSATNDEKIGRMDFTVYAVNMYAQWDWGYGVIYDSGDFHLYEQEYNDENQINCIINNINNEIKRAYAEIRRRS